MRANKRIRLYMQILFVLTVIITITLIYVNSRNKVKDGNVSRFFPQINNMQERVDKYPNGKIRAVGNIKGYGKEGRWVYYDSNGNIELIETYENGVLINSEKPDSKD